jgi:hypothetical protein
LAEISMMTLNASGTFLPGVTLFKDMVSLCVIRSN